MVRTDNRSYRVLRGAPPLVLSYIRLVLGERSPLGRAAALLARCPPPTTSNLDLLCGADRHPSSPFALSGSSVGQRGIFAQTTQLLVPAKQTISVSWCSSTSFSTSAGPSPAPATPAPATHSTAASPVVPPCVPLLLPPPLLLSRVRTHRRRTARRLLRCCYCYWSRTAWTPA